MTIETEFKCPECGNDYPKSKKGLYASCIYCEDIVHGYRAEDMRARNELMLPRANRDEC